MQQKFVFYFLLWMSNFSIMENLEKVGPNKDQQSAKNQSES